MYKRNKMKKFEGSYDRTLTAGLNFPEGSKNAHDSQFLYVRLERLDGSNYSFAAFSREETVALRDHLNNLLGEPTPAPVVSDRAVEAMSELAYQMSLLDFTSIDEFTAALNNFNKPA